MKAKPNPKDAEIELRPDGWERFREAVRAAAKSGPKHRGAVPPKAKERPASKGRNKLTIAALAVMISMSAIPGTTFADYSDHDRVVAQAEIRSNFDPPICPLVVVALGLPDGSIQALCDDGETFLIGKTPGLDRKMTMRCSALEGLLDIKGCTQWGGDTLRNRETVLKIELACGKLRLPLSECIAKLRDLAQQPSSATAPAPKAAGKLERATDGWSAKDLARGYRILDAH